MRAGEARIQSGQRRPQRKLGTTMQGDHAANAIAKAGRRLIPFLIVCYAVNFLDRVNVGFAALAMNEDLGFTPEVFGFGAGIFFVGYILFEVPSNLALHRFGARLWIGRIMISWGLVATAMAFIAGETSFYLSALCPRCRRGRILSRHHPLFDLLVSARGARTHRLLVHGGGADRHGDRRTAVGGAAAASWFGRPRGLAVAVHHRRAAGGAARHRRAFLSHQPAKGRRMAIA